MTLVTGGTGMVGAHLLYELTRMGIRPKVLCRPQSNTGLVKKIFAFYTPDAETLFAQIEWIPIDILDYQSVEDALAGISTIYHCAAMVSFNKNDNDTMLETNVHGTANLVNAAIFNKVARFCHVSSIAALGKTEDNSNITEETHWTPSKQKSGYSISKFFSEMEVWRGAEEGLAAVVINPAVIIGPGNWETGSPKFFSTIERGLNFYTKGITGFVDVRDVVKAMVMLMSDKHFEQVKRQRFILSAGNMSYQDFFFKIADNLNKPRPRHFASDPLLQMAWRAAKALSILTRKPPLITRDTVTGINQNNYYSGEKIIGTIGLEYRALDTSISEIAEIFKKTQVGH